MRADAGLLIKTTKPAPARKMSRELSALRDKSRTRRLTKEESHRQQVLLDTLDRFILIRAQALVLLKQRGCDVSGRIADGRNVVNGTGAADSLTVSENAARQLTVTQGAASLVFNAVSLSNVVLNGNDFLNGGAGNDSLLGGDGNLDGQGGADTIAGNEGVDTLNNTLARISLWEHPTPDAEQARG